ncbi:Peptidase M56 BlaR1 OS=Emticicia oligotrophica (strain DSM 17448 / GPTSA100-15) GN=Emtol_2757 PE=4 SV=1: Peptidase_M56 [Gemmata massiliana]|uniref:Peptidase M56 domain-containing protein n=1 Tax=Gemmata massiliana TaxID=1210884 RepID=A0A6P2DLY6_9BACT|nr:M56 family metallopeptidase [Gemmata massiliana]VTS02816.1 Peptidase M56 BlaR1 OS=Emticicia oligotrophica (strain DSM 17448 / GPTSA100-15) GN=Emtol_2757 PE=4 SV=1: Peptidase_M56 [Gemmata massiliana]
MEALAWLGSWGGQVAGQTLVCLVLGGWLSVRLERTPARAHTVVVLALGTALVTPFASAVVGALGYGAFVAPSAATVYRLPDDDRHTFLSGEWRVWLWACWAAGSAALLGHLGVSYTRGRYLVARSECVTDPQLLGALAAAQQSLGLRACPQLRASSEVPCPVIWIWGREPVVIIPDNVGVPGGLDWEAVFVHELAHLRRRDHLTRLFADVVAACLFWNPAVWWVRGQMNRVSEFACDDWVIRSGKSPVDFAHALLCVRQVALGAPAPPALALISRRNTLKDRVLRLLRVSEPPPQCGSRWTAVATLVAVGVVLALAVAQASPRPTNTDALAAPIIHTPD